MHFKWLNLDQLIQTLSFACVTGNDLNFAG